VVPGNDDAGRAISLYCDLIARAAIDGISRAQANPASMSVLPRSLCAKSFRRAQPTGFQGWPARAVRRRPQEADGRVRRDREEVQRSRYSPLLAASRAHHDTAHKIGEKSDCRAAQMPGSLRPRRDLGKPK